MNEKIITSKAIKLLEKQKKELVQYVKNSVRTVIKSDINIAELKDYFNDSIIKDIFNQVVDYYINKEIKKIDEAITLLKKEVV